MSNPATPCPVCQRKPRGEFWECSHVDCPRRHPITAQPSEQEAAGGELDEPVDL